jgi:hypothetical protein
MNEIRDISPERKGPHRYQPGHTGNLVGRPKGSRNLLREAVFKDLLADWEAHGKGAIEAFRAERPHDYVKVVAGLLPKELNVTVNELEGYSDAEISAQLKALVREMRAAGLDPFAGAEEPLGPEQTGPLSPLR